MSAENPNDQVPQNPEQKEWQGQRWEYLSLYGGKLHGVRGAELFFLKDLRKYYPFLEPYEEEIRQKIENLSERTRKSYDISAKDKDHLPLFLLFNILGSYGWELVAMTPSTEADFRSYLFKRNLQPSS